MGHANRRAAGGPGGALVGACLVVLVAAGVAGGAPGSTAEAATAAPESEADGSGSGGCATDRTAVVHRPGGVAVDGLEAEDLPFPCTFPVGARALEPTIGVAADGTVFYQAAADSSVPFTDAPRVLRSLDGGATWSDVSPEVAGQAAHPATVDPYLHLDPATSRVFTVDAAVGCAFVSSSDDQGGSWTTVPALCGGGIDHQSIFSGPPAVSPTIGYPNVVYWCAVHAGGGQYSAATTCSKSLDGGRTFVPTGSPPYHADPAAGDGNFGVDGWCDGLAGRGVVGPDGTVYVPKGWCGRPTLARSTDEGATWTRTVVDDERGMARTVDDRPDHEAHVAVDDDGNLYYVWAGHDRLPYLATSTDGGVTWSTPMMVAPPRVTEVDRPHIAVSAPGVVAISYFGSDTSPGPPFPGEDGCTSVDGAADLVVPCPQPEGYDGVMWNGYVTVTTDALGADPLLVSATVNDPADPLHRGPCGPGGCGTLGDGISSAGFDHLGRPVAAFVDLCPGPCGPGEEAGAPEGLFVRLEPGGSQPASAGIRFTDEGGTP